MAANGTGKTAMSEDLELNDEKQTGAKGEDDDRENDWEVGIQTGASYDSSN